MTSSNESNNTSETNDNGANPANSANLAQVAGRLLGAMPPRMPQRLPSPYGCGWCGEREAPANGSTEGSAGGSADGYKQSDPAAWVLHVLQEHLRGLLGQARVSVDFNSAGGATVRLHDGYPEDVALIRDALGVDLFAVTEFEVKGESVCAVHFGCNPFGKEVTAVWYTTPDFLRLAAELATAGWPFGPVI